MRSRYDLMDESKAVDSYDNTSYPDPLSIDYTEAELSKVPGLAYLSTADVRRFWVLMYKSYGLTDNDDILLTMNNVPYIGMLDAGDPIYLIKKVDLLSFTGKATN